MAQRQRRPTPSKQTSSLKPFYYALAVIVLAGAGWIAYSLASSGGDPATQPIALTGMTDEQLMSVAQPENLGADDAPVRIVVFSDFTCPSCAHWNTMIEPGLKQDYIAPGKVRLTYYDFPLGGGGHIHGFLAARAARCAGDQDKFWEFHDALFRTQANWALSPTPPVNDFVDLAGQLGLDTGAFKSCVNSDQHAELVSANKQLGIGLNVNSTPTVYLNTSYLEVWSDYGAVKAAIDAALSEGN